MKLRNSLVLVTSIIALSGCGTFGQLEQGLKAFVGKHERDAFGALGYPTTKQEFSGNTVYIWGTSHSGTVFIPQTTTTTGYIGTTPIYGTTTTNQAISVNYNCTIKLIVGKDSIITGYEYEGNLGGCQSYIHRTQQYLQTQPVIKPIDTIAKPIG